MTKLCEGRVAIITGAGRGIGREHALLLAHHGAKVVVNDLGGSMDGEGNDQGPAHDVVDEIKAMGGEAIANGDDISDWDGAERLVQSAVDTFGGLDILINNAGILRDRMLTNMSEAEWDAVIKVHLKGTFAPARHAAAYWRERSKAGETNDARIINTSSPSGIYGNVGQTNYGAAKAGIASFTIIAAKELGRYGVTVNAIAPAALTRMTEGLGMGNAPEEIKEQMSPAHIAPIVCWLASPEAAHVTGRVFDVTGRMLSVSEGWHRGPSLENPPDDLGRAGSARSRSWSPRPAPTPTCRATTRSHESEQTDHAHQPRCRRHQVRARPPLLDQQGRPDLRPRRRRRCRRPARRAGLHHREHQRRRPAGAADDGRRARHRSAPAWATIGTFNPAMLVHGEQGITLHQEIPVEGELEAVGEVTGIYDKGKGAVVVSESTATLVEHRRAAVLHPHVGLHPGRGRLGRRPRPVRHAEPGARARARPHRHRADPPRPGPALPPVRRPQPAALRPVLRGDGRLRPADPPRPVHLRLHRPGPAPHPVRERPGAVQGHGRPVLVAGDAGRARSP